MFRFFHEDAKYTKIPVSYNVLISGKLWYPAILGPWGAGYRKVYCVYLRTHFLVDGLFKMLCIDNSSNFSCTVRRPIRRYDFHFRFTCVHSVIVNWVIIIYIKLILINTVTFLTVHTITLILYRSYWNRHRQLLHKIMLAYVAKSHEVNR